MTDEGRFLKCKGCQENVDTKCAVVVVKAQWHPSCFRCSVCNQQLSTWYIKKGGNLFCRKDYWAKYRHLCNGCSLVISGPVMVAGEHRYHPECFQCCHCSCYIGQDEPYVLVERSTLFCGVCYNGRVNSEPRAAVTSIFAKSSSLLPPPAASTTTTTSSTVTLSVTTNTDYECKSQRIPHTIQMVKVAPSVKYRQFHHQTNENDKEDCKERNNDEASKVGEVSQNGQCGLRLSGCPNSGTASQHSFILEERRTTSYARIAQVGTNSCFEGLEVGDYILEVNGSSMRDKRLGEICDAICNGMSCVNIVVERDPTPLPTPTQDKETVTVSNASAADATCVTIDNTLVRLRNKGTLRARGHSPDRRRSKSPSPCPSSGRQRAIDLSRSRSFTSQNLDHRVFRPTDLVLGEILGQGFFGKALKAKHKITGEQMVLKELHNFDEDAQKGFLMEVSMLRNLSHPCVLKFLGVLYRGKKLTLVTEFINGGTLSDLLLDKTVELTWIQRLKLVKDIANGMAYLHSMDIIHRDLNSNNCFVRKDQSVVVGDFGLAKIFPRNSYQVLPKQEEGNGDGKEKARKKRTLTRRKRQTVVGNPYWMAPEMILSKGIYDEKVDIFSYGVIVFETIARVTADPDYLPRSVDLGVNVEAFHRRFCHDTPEPYAMMATLCSQIEPEKRPSFDEIQVLCEALHLHLEHGRSFPQELKGSTVDFYHATKERLYGKNYRDTDSVEEAEYGNEKKKTESLVPAQQQVNHNESTNSNIVLDDMSIMKDETGVLQAKSASLTSVIQANPSESIDSSRIFYSDSSSVFNDRAMDLENAGLNTSFLKDADSLGFSLKDSKPSSSSYEAVTEDSTYFSCSSSSLSPFASLSSLTTDGFVTCKSSPVSSFEGETDFTFTNSNNDQHFSLLNKPTTNESKLHSSEPHSNFYDVTGVTGCQTVVPLSSLNSVTSSQSFFPHSDKELLGEYSYEASDKDFDMIGENSMNTSLSDKHETIHSNINIEVDCSMPESDIKSKCVAEGQFQSLAFHEVSLSPNYSSLDDIKLSTPDFSQIPAHHDSYMCSSRRRQKKAKNSMKLEQTSPTHSPPSAMVDSDNIGKK